MYFKGGFMLKKILIASGLLLFTASIATASSTDIAVLYNGNNSVNKFALHFMGQQYKKLNSPYKFKAIGNPQDIKPGMYKAILVLNTGQSSGIDPKLADFIKSWNNKNEIILITLKKDSSQVKVESLPASAETLGVDAVSAASTWNDSDMTVHEEWTQKVLDLLNKK
jgi:hypothetical protein